MHSRDIHGQSGKFSYIAPNFYTLFALLHFNTAVLPKIVPALLPEPRGTSLLCEFLI